MYAPIRCDNGSLISQVHFSGSYSDNVRAYCKPTGASDVRGRLLRGD
ncbi:MULTISPECIES: hypothetical protein [Sorangium]